MLQYKITKIFDVEDDTRSWLEIFSLSHNKKGFGGLCKKTNKWIALTIFDNPAIFIKETEDTDKYFKSTKDFYMYKHVYCDKYQDWCVLKSIVPAGSLVSILDDCIKVSCLIPKELYVFQNDCWINKPFTEVYTRGCLEANKPEAVYSFNVKTYPNKWISESKFTPGLYGCTTKKQLKEWGCSKIHYDKMNMFQ